MKWIKLEERKPGKGHNYFVKATRKGQGYLHNDTALYRLELDTWEFMHDNGTYVVEWLDETPTTTVASPVSEEGGIEEKIRNMDDKTMEAVIKAVSLIDLSECYFEHGYEDHMKYVNALSPRSIVVDSMQFDGNLFWMMNNSGSFSLLNPMYKAYQVVASANSVKHQGDVKVDEQGWSYNYKWLKELTYKVNGNEHGAGLSMEEVEIVLLAVDYPQSPSIPQPGFIEMLMAANPYKGGISTMKQSWSVVWNECVDKATELLKGKGEERRLQRQEDNNEHLDKCLKMLKYLYMNEYCGEHGEEVRQLIMPRPQPKTSFEGLE